MPTSLAVVLLERTDRLAIEEVFDAQEYCLGLPNTGDVSIDASEESPIAALSAATTAFCPHASLYGSKASILLSIDCCSRPKAGLIGERNRETGLVDADSMAE
jgi:hypothetical protein